MTGTITNEANHLRCIKWEVPNYFSNSQKADSYLQSPEISFAGRTWHLRIYPNGLRSNGSVEWVGLYLLETTSRRSPDVVIEFRFFFEYCEDGNPARYPSGYSRDKCTIRKRTLYGTSHFIKRTELHRRRAELVSGGVLKILVKVYLPDVVSCDSTTQTGSLDSNTIAHQFHTLLQSERKSDVTVKVGSRSFRAHRLILGARSPVFSAMFEHSMRENNYGVIDIVDCEPDIFALFLEFVYTGILETLSSENVFGLLTLADKYNFPDLKERCLLYMKDNLSLGVVCDVLNAANQHCEEDLLNAAKDLVLGNIKEVTRTQKWIDFMKTNPVLGTEILLSFVSVGD